MRFPVRQVVNFIENEFSGLSVQAREHISGGAVSLDLAPAGSDTQAARYRAEIKTAEVRTRLLEAGWELVPERVPQFHGITVLFPGWSFCQREVEQIHVRAIVPYESRDLAKKAGYHWDDANGRWHKWMPAAELASHRATCGFRVGEPESRRSVKAEILLIEDAPKAPPDSVTQAALTLAAQRKTFGHGGGRPKMMRSCPGCGSKFSALDMRRHTPQCAAVRKQPGGRPKVMRPCPFCFKSFCAAAMRRHKCPRKKQRS